MRCPQPGSPRWAAEVRRGPAAGKGAKQRDGHGRQKARPGLGEAPGKFPSHSLLKSGRRDGCRRAGGFFFLRGLGARLISIKEKKIPDPYPPASFSPGTISG